MAERDLLVRILGDDRDLQRAIKNTDRSLERIDNRTATFGRNIGKAFAAAGIAVGASEVFRLAGDAVAAASDLNEQLSRTEVILGASAAATIEWSETTADAFGISQRAALDAAATFAGLFQTVGVEQSKVAAFSRQVVELAADLAALRNVDVGDALTALRSGLAGESEPLRRFNIFLSEATVATEALAATGKRNAAELTIQEKTLARYSLILQQAAPSMGNFAATSGELAGQSKILRANMDDLSTDVGQLLIPALTDLVGTFNDAVTAGQDLAGVLGDLKALAPIDLPVTIPITVLFQSRTPGGIADIAGDIADQVRSAVLSGLTAGMEPIEGLERLLRGEAGQGLRFFPAPVDTRGQAKPGDVADEVEKNTDDTVDAVERVRKARERQRKAFNALVKGLGLKLDKAGLTQGLADDLAVLRELERAILRQIAREGKTFKLVQQLTQTRLQINAAVQQQAADAQQAGEDAFRAVVDALNLDIEVARASKSLDDDLPALQALEQAILRRITSEGETTDLLRQLFNVREEQRRVAEQLAEQRRERRQGRQFEALGLTEEGERPTPGVGALQRRLKNLREQVKGTALDTEKTRRELDRIAEVLSGKFGAVGKQVREAILEMFNEIAGALEEGGSRKGPLTKTSGLNTKKILAGLGLSEEEIRALRGRLSSINTAGNQLAGLGTPGPTRGLGAGAGATTGVVVENFVTVQVGGQKVAAVVTKEQQKTKRRNPQQKRGPNRNR